ncbi:MAG: addiction module toxin RelE [Lachnospiraceae bacterium]|nr:addiction module toxin RelE [Lachnospiraceae bacterium]
MFRTFIQTQEFSRKWDNLGLNDDDLRLLELDIINNMDKYPRIRGTGGLQKARMPLENKGKSGGARVCFADFAFAETTYLITIYGKKDNLSKEERNAIRKAMDFLKKSLGGK